jgi:hypothetical protein
VFEPSKLSNNKTIEPSKISRNKKVKPSDDSEYQKWFDKRMKINQERLKTFNNTCEKYKNKLRFETLEESYQHHKSLSKFKVMGCLMQKVGSTSLQKTIKEINKVNYLYPPTVQQVKHRSKEWKTFIFVRDPMERLASCYNDKMIEPLKDHLKPDFVKAFRLDVKRLAMRLKGHKRFYQGEAPRFEDFLVTKVLNEDWGGTRYGRHWAPYYKECAPCTPKYDFIGLLDPTMEETKVS